MSMLDNRMNMDDASNHNVDSSDEMEFLSKLGEAIFKMKHSADDEDDNGEDENVLVPIRSTIMDAMDKYGAHYGEMSVMLLRQYFIALLNIGYIKLNDLDEMVEKFVSKIDRIEYCELDGRYIKISDKVMYVSTELSNGMNDDDFDGFVQAFEDGLLGDLEAFGVNDESSEELEDLFNVFDDDDDDDDSFSEEFEIEFYKAVTSVILGMEDVELKGLAFILCEIVAEKVWTVDTLDERIIFPTGIDEYIGDELVTTRTGYKRCNLPISLFKQFCVAYGYNEYSIFHDLFYSGFSDVFKSLFDLEKKMFLLLLNKHFCYYIERVNSGKFDMAELDLIEKYQIELCKKFKKANLDYLCFLTLSTSENLRRKLTEMGPDLSKCDMK